MPFFKLLGRKFKGLSPAAIREIIAVVVILCLAIALSLPEFKSDRGKAELQKRSMQVDKSIGILSNEENGGK